MALTKPKTTQLEEHPDARKHRYISFAKSAVRIGACVALAYYELQLTAILLIVAELLGIYEELV
jgi:hypothetical protein